MLAMVSCAGNTQHSNYHLDANQFAEKINENPTAPVIDVRTAEEFSNGHLRNARNIDWIGSEFETSMNKYHKTQPMSHTQIVTRRT